VGESTVKMEIKDDRLHFTLTDGLGNSLLVEATYTVKDGVMESIVKKVEHKGIEGGPSEGDKLTFRVKVDKDRMTVSDLKSVGHEEAKQFVEGEYKKGK
jgi:hypothetical protein